MKNKIVLLGLLSLSVKASEHEFKALIDRNNQQSLAFLLIAASIGANELFKNANEFCQVNAPFCWKLAVPVASAAVLTGGILYRKLRTHKG